MHRVRFRDPAGSVRTGQWHDDHVSFGGETYSLAEVEILPPCEPTKIVCIGRNYADHAAELDNDVPDRPLLFLKPPNTLAAHGDTVTLPAGKERVDWEAELAVVIGTQARNVAAEDAMDYVAGFTCMNDVSNRDDQNKEQNWVRGKAFDNSAPLGPVLATPDEVPDDASVELRVNGETKQSSSRDYMMFSVPDLIEEITTYLTLEPGDVVSTGTPEGVGPLSDGDHVAVEVEGVGVLEHDVRSAE
ncbi:2-keto-4-pentenoate hydratase [Halogeometricum borinquense DSM 11551]|uniref:2-keto-4-pentenoate hydratase n=2 Tax=Halogeometricum borinquense TaxID=60847 RepID=E4NNN8_HALBP|nr:fumarylacetoacetate hydrolase family protein [Halogeometricum borinquense]ADQ67502.1 2-keto-4-pentenoate hydratase/2-oxohepta-3-ene-1,7-dioic acid hydratase [Halogeometricum borinquense DSM 11551]ELY23816.1 2-keto-4-pentenoate hydratase [Halogeometricum borinquense DSM 11551]RYJ13523.1 FAA hydrolase family protein [Halogeometricum borinquense]